MRQIWTTMCLASMTCWVLFAGCTQQPPGGDDQLAFFCTSNTTKADCEVDNCVWNDDADPKYAYCLSPKLSLCSSATVMGSCSQIWQCIWSAEGKSSSSGKPQHCFGTLPIPLFGYSCSDYPEDICATTGCIYDSTAKKCNSRYTSSCDGFANEATCEAVGCLWDSGTNKCLSTNPATTRCDHFTDFGKTTCEKAGCLFDDKANPPVCASKYVACAEYEPTIDSCPISLGCRISGDGGCESANCNFNTSQLDCQAQPGCTWNIYCRNP